jgi:Putative SAM-dependent methyltransferase
LLASTCWCSLQALVKKEMQVLQCFFEESSSSSNSSSQHSSDSTTNTVEDAQALFTAALALATVKVVVKRPLKGELLVPHPKPSHTVKGRNNRFDVYAVPTA